MAWERVYDYVDAYADEIGRIYAESERIMLEKVAKRLARGIDEPGWAEKKLAEVRALKKDISGEITDLGENSQDIEDAINQAYDAGAQEAVDELKRAKLKDMSASAFTRGNALKALVKETVGAVGSTHLRMLRVTQDVYRNAVAAGAAQVVNGTQTVREAIQGVLNQFAEHGISGYKDSAGRWWNAQSYAEMAVRTAAGNAADQGHIDKLQANDQDLGIISSHGNCCPLCAPWEGRVVSFSGESKKYPSLQTAIDAGFKHPNCRHTIGLYIEDVTRPHDVPYDPEAYKARQQQRANEQHIRRWKRREAVAITPEEQKKAHAKVRQWQATQREHIKQANLAGEKRHGEGWITLKRDYSREQGLAVKPKATGLVNESKSGIMPLTVDPAYYGKLSSREVRDWYVSSLKSVVPKIDPALPIKDRARTAFDARNEIRAEARKLMSNPHDLEEILSTHHDLTWEEMIDHKRRKGLTGDDIYKDIFKTATKTNSGVDKKFGAE
ncbi:phage minor capsid protein [bacterium]|nr:phage minor capsid protein [bacterium]